MNLKTFKAGSMQEALTMVKREFGHRAVILGTRSWQTNGFLGFGRKTIVEITARPGDRAAAATAAPARAASGATRRSPASGQAAARSVSSSAASRAAMPGATGIAAKPTAAPQQNRLTQTYGRLVAEARQQAVDVSADELRGEINGLKEMVGKLINETRSARMPDVPEELLEVYLSLLSSEVAEEIAKDLVKRICAELPQRQWKCEHSVRQTLVKYIADQIDVSGPTVLEGPSPRVIALIGPTGVGKTTSIAKLAAQFKLKQNYKVGLITIDTYRIGAVDQLRTYADIINVPLKVVLTPRELKRAVAEFSDMDFILIDTAGRSQRDTLKMNELRQFLDAAQPHETHLVLSGTSSPQTTAGILDRFCQFNVDRILLTKLDESVGFGIVLTVLQKARRKLSYVTTGQDVPDDIEPAGPRKLAELIVPQMAMQRADSERLGGNNVR